MASNTSTESSETSGSCSSFEATLIPRKSAASCNVLSVVPALVPNAQQEVTKISSDSVLQTKGKGSSSSSSITQESGNTSTTSTSMSETSSQIIIAPKISRSMYDFAPLGIGMSKSEYTDGRKPKAPLPSLSMPLVESTSAQTAHFPETEPQHNKQDDPMSVHSLDSEGGYAASGESDISETTLPKSVSDRRVRGSEPTIPSISSTPSFLNDDRSSASLPSTSTPIKGKSSSRSKTEKYESISSVSSDTSSEKAGSSGMLQEAKKESSRTIAKKRSSLVNRKVDSVLTESPSATKQNSNSQLSRYELERRREAIEKQKRNSKVQFDKFVSTSYYAHPSSGSEVEPESDSAEKRKSKSQKHKYNKAVEHEVEVKQATEDRPNVATNSSMSNVMDEMAKHSSVHLQLAETVISALESEGDMPNEIDEQALEEFLDWVVARAYSSLANIGIRDSEVSISSLEMDKTLSVSSLLSLTVVIPKPSGLQYSEDRTSSVDLLAASLITESQARLEDRIPPEIIRTKVRLLVEKAAEQYYTQQPRTMYNERKGTTASVPTAVLDSLAKQKFTSEPDVIKTLDQISSAHLLLADTITAPLHAEGQLQDFINSHALAGFLDWILQMAEESNMIEPIGSDVSVTTSSSGYPFPSRSSIQSLLDITPTPSAEQYEEDQNSSISSLAKSLVTDSKSGPEDHLSFDAICSKLRILLEKAKHEVVEDDSTDSDTYVSPPEDQRLDYSQGSFESSKSSSGESVLDRWEAKWKPGAHGKDEVSMMKVKPSVSKTIDPAELLKQFQKQKIENELTTQLVKSASYEVPHSYEEELPHTVDSEDSSKLVRQAKSEIQETDSDKLHLCPSDLLLLYKQMVGKATSTETVPKRKTHDAVEQEKPKNLCPSDLLLMVKQLKAEENMKQIDSTLPKMQTECITPDDRQLPTTSGYTGNIQEPLDNESDKALFTTLMEKVESVTGVLPTSNKELTFCPSDLLLLFKELTGEVTHTTEEPSVKMETQQMMPKDEEYQYTAQTLCPSDLLGILKQLKAAESRKHHMLAQTEVEQHKASDSEIMPTSSALYAKVNQTEMEDVANQHLSKPYSLSYQFHKEEARPKRFFTPSELCAEVEKREHRVTNRPTEVPLELLGSVQQGNQFDSTPSSLMAKIEQREQQELSGGVGSVPSMVTPSELFDKVQKREQPVPTPSSLHTRIGQREKQLLSGGVGSVHSMLTPSELLAKVQKREQLITPSSLHTKIEQRGKQLLSAGVGSVPSMVKPSELFDKVQKRELLVSTPSSLHAKIEQRGKQLLSGGVGSVPSMVTPSELFNKIKKKELPLPTPSSLHTKIEQREKQVLSGGVGSVPSMVTPSELFDKVQKRELLVSTPSSLHAKTEQREKQLISGGVGSVPSMVTPSELFDKIQKREQLVSKPLSCHAKIEKHERELPPGDVGSVPSMVTPSLLFEKVQQRGQIASKPSLPCAEDDQPEKQKLSKVSDSFPSVAESQKSYAKSERREHFVSPSELYAKMDQREKQKMHEGQQSSTPYQFDDMSDHNRLARDMRPSQLIITPDSGAQNLERQTITEKTFEHFKFKPMEHPIDTSIPILSDYSLKGTEQFGRTRGPLQQLQTGITKPLLALQQCANFKFSSSSEESLESEDGRAMISVPADIVKKKGKKPLHVNSPGVTEYIKEMARQSAAEHQTPLRFRPSSGNVKPGDIKEAVSQEETKINTVTAPDSPTVITNPIRRISSSLFEFLMNAAQTTAPTTKNLESLSVPLATSLPEEWGGYVVAQYENMFGSSPVSDIHENGAADDDDDWETVVKWIVGSEELLDIQPNLSHTESVLRGSSTEQNDSWPSAEQLARVNPDMVPERVKSSIVSLFPVEDAISYDFIPREIFEQLSKLSEKITNQNLSPDSHSPVPGPSKLSDDSSRQAYSKSAGNISTPKEFSSPGLDVSSKDLLGVQSFIQKMSGASLPSSRTASPAPSDQGSTSRRRAMGSNAEMRSFIIEKEVIESQLRKLQVENSTLQTENKLLKDKYNRATNRIEKLEHQLLATHHETELLEQQMNNDLTRIAPQSSSDKYAAQEKIVSLTKELEIVKAENVSLQKQVDISRATEGANFKHYSSEHSRLFEAFQMEVHTVKDELNSVKKLLHDAEGAREQAVLKQKESSTQVVKLTELKAALQQQLEEVGGSSAAERQVRSLEQRLKITEDRLHQERADRAGKLSQIEDKLLNENAQLQVIREERDLFEDRLNRAKENIEDLAKEKEDMEANLKQKMESLVSEKHSMLSKLRNAEDRAAAIDAENVSLRNSLRTTAGHPPMKSSETNIRTLEAQTESLRNELGVARGNLEQFKRQNALLETEAASLQKQLNAKAKALDEALRELSKSQLQKGGSPGSSSYTQKKIEVLNAEMDQLQAQLRQKSRQLERVTSSEGEQTAQVHAMKDSLSSVNHELEEKSTQLKMLSVNLQQQKEKCDKLEQDLTKREELLSSNIADVLAEGKLSSMLYADSKSSKETLTQAETRMRLLQFEKDNIQGDMKRAQAAMDAVVKENSDLMGQLREVKQELVRERAQLCQLAADKVDVDQKLHICVEEQDFLKQRVAQQESEISKHNGETAQLISRLNTDHSKAMVNYETKYHSVDHDTKYMAAELGTAKRLVGAREKEVDMLRDTLQRQKLEMDGLHRKIDILQEESQSSKNGIEKFTTDLTSKMREETIKSEATQMLSSEKARLEMERLQMEKQYGLEKTELERRGLESVELSRKLDRASDKLHHSEKELHQCQTRLVALETEMKHMTRNMASTESERDKAREQVERLNEELRTLTTAKSGLEHRLNMDQTTLFEEKSNRSHIREELTNVTHQYEVLQREYNILSGNMETERRALQTVKAQCQVEEDRNFKLQDANNTLRMEVETVKGHLAEHRNTIDQYKKDKQTLYQDVQELCRKMADKDDLISRLQEKCSETVESIQKDFTHEKSFLSLEREKLETQLKKARDEIGDLQEKLRQRQLQLENYMRTNHELESNSKGFSEAESQRQKLATQLQESKRNLTNLQADHTRLQMQHTKAQADLEEQTQTLVTVKEQLRSQRDQHTREIHEIRHSHTEQSHKQDLSKADLKEEINKITSSLKATEISLSNAMESKVSLASSNKALEKSLDSLKSQLHEETTARKLAEQNVVSLQQQMKDLHAKKSGFNEKTSELSTNLARVEAELNIKKEKCVGLQHELQEAVSKNASAEQRSGFLQQQVTDLQTEAQNLRSQLEMHKQTLAGKNKRLSLEMKQQLEHFDEERGKLVLQCQQLSADLEAARESLAAKGREALRFQEEAITLESKANEANAQLKHVRDALKMEKVARDSLEQKLQALELDLARVRSRGDGDSDSSRLEVTRLELNKMRTELTKQWQQKLDAQNASDKEQRQRDAKAVEDYRKKISNLESSLSQEQALHIVTKTQLSSIEEDNTRLRSQLQAARKRNTNIGEERNKSRMEEINEIIARSNTRAQQLLATGGYGGDLLGMSTPRDGALSSMNYSIPLFVNTSLMSPRSDLNRSTDLSGHLSPTAHR